MPFVEYMIDKLAVKGGYCFLYGYKHIYIASKDQEKTTFTCPYGTFAFKRMSFGLWNAPSTFKYCMITIFSYMVKDTIDVFMDDFCVVGYSFDRCLNNLC